MAITRAIVIDNGKSLKGTPYYDDKVKVRVPELHGMGNLLDRKETQDSETVNDADLPWFVVSLPLDSYKESTFVDAKIERINPGDTVYVDAYSRIVTGLFVKSSESGILDDSTGLNFSNILGNIKEALVDAAGFVSNVISTVVDNVTNNIPEFKDFFGAPISKGSYRISSPYGIRKSGMHYGVDLAGAVSTPIYAAGSGRVAEVVSKFAPNTGNLSYKGMASYGNYVLIDHGTFKGHHYYTRYAHLNGVNVSVGQSVTGTQSGSSATQIGILGHTGCSTGPHCHFEVAVDGKSGQSRKNPANYISL